MSKTKIRVLAGLWILMALSFSVSFPFVAAMSCNQINDPLGADQTWYILHLCGGSLFWIQNVLFALTVGMSLIVFRFRPFIVALCTYSTLTWLGILMLMIRVPEIFPLNAILLAAAVSIAACGIATITIVLRKSAEEIFKRKGQQPNPTYLAGLGG